MARPATDAKFEGLDPAYGRILVIIIVINAAMFVIELIAGFTSGSQALKADALDFLGDSLTYTITLLVIGRSLRTRATAALIKGISLGLVGLWVFGSTAYQVLVLRAPDALTMSVVGALAFAANLGAALLLVRYREGDANVRSVWLCSRNDAIGNLLVVAAGLGVFATASGWPDLLVAAMAAGLFLQSAVKIVRQARTELAGETT